MSVQSLDGEQMPSFTINASNSTSTTMYLVPQNTTANLSPSEKAVLVTMPMFHTKDQSVKVRLHTEGFHSRTSLNEIFA